MAILANSMREPTEDQILETVEQYNSFAAEDLTDELRCRYTAFCKLRLDVDDALVKYRQERYLPTSYRILDASKNRYLTWLEADPFVEDCKNDIMAEFPCLDDAKRCADIYQQVMSSMGICVEVEVLSFNRYFERL